MKKLIIAAVVVAVGLGGLLFVKNRLGMDSASSAIADGRIAITNDSSDTISVEYKIDDKNVAEKIEPGAQLICGSNGFVRVFTAKKSGSYELMYPADGGMREAKLSQISAVAQKKEMSDEISTAKGMLGDIKVMYEEVRELD